MARQNEPVDHSELDGQLAERTDEQPGGDVGLGEPMAGECDALAQRGRAQHQIRRGESRTAANIERARAVRAAPRVPAGARIAIVEQPQPGECRRLRRVPGPGVIRRAHHRVQRVGHERLALDVWPAAITAITASPGAAWWSLVLVFIAIPAACLTLWATAGAALAQLLARPRVASWVDRVMGAILVATAAALVLAP
jgi:hypothetical protein